MVSYLVQHAESGVYSSLFQSSPAKTLLHICDARCIVVTACKPTSLPISVPSQAGLLAYEIVFTILATADMFRIPNCTAVFNIWGNNGFVGSIFDWA